MSKFLLVGLSLPQIIDCVTANAAQALRLPNKGRLAVGCDADFTILMWLNRRRFLQTQNNKAGAGKP